MANSKCVLPRSFLPLTYLGLKTGQMIRYYFYNKVPTILVVPEDWKNRRNREGPKGWYPQFKELIEFLGLKEKIRIVLLDDVE
ncbi:MAG: hypothetical protein JRN67_08830, partial [Nitrososphaerota archaeon]|nr:hypothetical protein [Nitrososphaerota archaeon]